MNDGTVTFLYSIPWATEPEHLFITWSSTSELFLNCKDRLNSLWWMRQIERGLNYSIAFTPSLNQIEQSDSRSSSFFMVSLQSSSPVRSHSLRSSPYRSSCLSSLFILNHYWTYFFFVNSITFFLFPWTYCIDWFSLLPLAPLPLGRVARAPFPISSFTVNLVSQLRTFVYRTYLFVLLQSCWPICNWLHRTYGRAGGLFLRPECSPRSNSRTKLKSLLIPAHACYNNSLLKATRLV